MNKNCRPVVLMSLQQKINCFMFGLFKKKSAVEKLYDRYEKLMAESHSLSKSDRTASDLKFSEAQSLLKEIEVLESKK